MAQSGSRISLDPPSSTLPDLAQLDAILAREGMARSPDIWISVHTLLARRAGQGQLTGDPITLASLLAPIICKSPEQQLRFADLIEEWVCQRPSPPKAVLAAPEQPRAARWRDRITQLDQTGRRIAAAALAVLLGVGIGLSYWPPSDPTIASTPINSETPGKVDSPPPYTQAVPIEDSVPPNPLPPPSALPQSWQTTQAWIGRILPWIPGCAFLGWLIWRYWGRMVLRRESPDGDALLSGLRLQLSTGAPFSGPETAAPLRDMKRPSWEPSRRLHLPASVEATARRAGHFTPRYRQRHRRAEYVVLVRTHHRDDQSAQFAELLLHKLRDEKVGVRGYRFRHDPRWLMPWDKNPRDSSYPLNLAKLTERFRDSRLIVISEGDILFDPFTGDSREWIKEFKSWARKVWLSIGDERGATEKLLRAHKFRVLPLGSASLGALSEWLLGSENQLSPQVAASDEPALPRILREAGESWLDVRPPRDADLKELIRQLESYLGVDGMMLLQALAVYPQPSWSLTYALDALLFSQASTETKAPAGLKRFFANRLDWLHRRRVPVAPASQIKP